MLIQPNHPDYSSQPDYLIIGHVTKDILPETNILGGTCSYAALTAHKLGQKVAIVTSAGEDIPSLSALNNIPTLCHPSNQSTTFENTYVDGMRYQKCWAKANTLTFNDIPSQWRYAPIIHLGPIAQEISPALCGQFPDSLIGVTVQGWLRGTDSAATVIYQANPDLDAWLGDIDVLILSMADVFGNRDALEFLVASAKLGVETIGPEGCIIYQDGQTIHVPVQREREVDPTGAGDIFAAAFLIQYYKTQNPVQAAQFANACASLSVGGVGLSAIPDLNQVQAHQAELYST